MCGDGCGCGYEWGSRSNPRCERSCTHQHKSKKAAAPQDQTSNHWTLQQSQLGLQKPINHIELFSIRPLVHSFIRVLVHSLVRSLTRPLGLCMHKCILYSFASSLIHPSFPHYPCSQYLPKSGTPNTSTQPRHLIPRRPARACPWHASRGPYTLCTLPAVWSPACQPAVQKDE